MKFIILRSIQLSSVFAMTMLLMVGCTSPTRVMFNGPPNSVLFVNEKPYHLPTQVELERPASAGETKRYDVSLAYTSQQARNVNIKGFLDMIGYNESDVDKMAVVTCNLDEEQLAKVQEGSAVIFKGQSASRQPVYELTFGKR
jgi:hypothetical protein